MAERVIHRGQCAARKVIPKRSLNSTHLYNRETACLSRLRSSKYVVRLLDHFEDENAYNIFTKWCAGGAMRLYEDYDEPRVKSIARDVLHGLRDAHAKGIVHGDVKQSNILFDDGRAVLSDFGDAKFSQTKERGTLRGTLAYMAPEMYCGDVSPEVDAWSTGVTVYSALARRLPFGKFGDTSRQVWEAIYCDKPDLNLMEGPVHAKDFVSTCLEKDPKDRPSIADLLNHPWIRDA